MTREDYHCSQRARKGETASTIFAAMLKGEFNGDMIKTKQDLLEYCKLDTLAMVEILNKLKKIKI
jgi:hypothetical protein